MSSVLLHILRGEYKVPVFLPTFFIKIIRFILWFEKKLLYLYLWRHKKICG